MANFGLLSSTAQVPLQATPMSMGTPVENESKRLTMEGKSLEVGEQKRQLGEESQDRDIIKQTLAEQDVDLATPDGIKNLLTRTKGKVSPGMYSKLTEHSQKIEQADIKRQSMLSEMSVQDLDEQAKRSSAQKDILSKYDEGYDQVKSEKGQPAAEAWLNSAIQKDRAKLENEKTPSGNPLFPPTYWQNPDGTPVDFIHAAISNGKHEADQTKLALDKAKASEQEARASKEQAIADDINRGTRGGKTMQSASVDGEWTVGPGGTFKRDRYTGVTERDPNPPKDLTPVGSTQAIKAQTVSDTPALTPKQNEFLADYQATTGKQVPGIPVGNGAAATRARSVYLATFADRAMERGYTGDEAGVVGLQRDAARESVKRLTTSNAAIRSSEKDLIGVGKLAVDELKKIGGIDSPLVRKYWNKTATQWAGDPEFIGLNAIMTNYVDTKARVLAGQSGAGATPVAYLTLAEKAIPNNPTLEQVFKLNETMVKLADIREKSFSDTRDELLHSASLKDKRPESASVSSGETKISAATQAGRDKEAGEQSALTEYQGAGGLDKARQDLKEINTGIRAASGDAKGILMQQKTRVEGAISNLEKGGKMPSAKNTKGWTLHTDKSGNKAYVSPDGKQFEEVK